jgi:hypothetical protein
LAKKNVEVKAEVPVEEVEQYIEVESAPIRVYTLAELGQLKQPYLIAVLDFILKSREYPQHLSFRSYVNDADESVWKDLRVEDVYNVFSVLTDYGPDNTLNTYDFDTVEANRNYYNDWKD